MKVSIEPMVQGLCTRPTFLHRNPLSKLKAEGNSGKQWAEGVGALRGSLGACGSQRVAIRGKGESGHVAAAPKDTNVFILGNSCHRPQNNRTSQHPDATSKEDPNHYPWNN